jgi:serine protease AprX
MIGRRKLQVLAAPVLASALLISSAGSPLAIAASAPPVVSIDSSKKIHPLLQYGAKVNPAEMVRVIVQKAKKDTKVALLPALVPGLLIQEEFDVVPAFAATLPAASLGLLAARSEIRYISPDGAVQVIPALPSLLKAKPAKPPKLDSAKAPKKNFEGRNLQTTYPIDTGAAAAWQGAIDGQVFNGRDVSVAVIDSGVDATHEDLSGQVIPVNVNKHSTNTGDGYGHGTHVAGIINGHDVNQHYLGVAPSSTLISVKVADDNGQAYVSDLLRGLGWVEANRAAYRIRALNLSVSSSVPESYATSPIDAAVERLWSEGVTVVAAAGNLGPVQDAVWYAPANDPYIITVGCLDENETTQPNDDSLCPISSRGMTEDGFAKPDLVAPGRKIASALATGPDGRGVTLASEFPDRITRDGDHIRLSGTSMAAPVVVGAIALLLDRKGDLSPDQIKKILVDSAGNYPGQTDKAGRLNIAAALDAAEHPSKVTQVPLPAAGQTPPGGGVTLVWDGARWGNTYWDGARWGSTYWDGARWGNAEWDGARWGSAYWDGARWGSAYWDGARWGSSSWDGARWGNASWDGARWGNASWDGARWGNASWDGARWGSSADFD